MRFGTKIAIGVTAVAAGVASLPIFAPDMPIAKEFTPDYARNVVSDSIDAALDPSVPKVLNVGSYSCSAYATRAAEVVNPGNEFSQGDAWELPRAGSNRLVWEGEASSLEDLMAQLSQSGQELKKGDILGIYNDHSSYNEEGRPYTHAAVYIGDGKIIHQYGVPVMRSDLDKFMGYVSRSSRAIGQEGIVQIKTVVRAGPGNNNDFDMEEIVPGIYKSVSE
jgi:hypothetical protein